MSIKYRSFLQNKLWRNKMPSYHALHGSKIDLKTLNSDEFDKQLRIKIKEEADEVALAATKANLIEKSLQMCMK